MDAPKYSTQTAKTMMNRVQNMPFRWSLNPYRGCTHGCSFCYARGTHSFLGFEADDSFRTQVLVKSNAAQALEAQLDKMARKHNWDLTALADEIGSIAVGTATDPYQPIEAKARITRSCLEVLARYQVPVSVTTRSPLILQDVDVLRELNLQSVNISVHTLSPEIWRGLEPASPSPVKRLEALSELRKADLPAGVFLAPIIPLLTDSTPDLSRLLNEIKRHGATFVMPSVLRLSSDIRPWFMEWIRDKYPDIERPLARLYRNGVPPQSYVELKMSRVRLLMGRAGLATYDQYTEKAPRARATQLRPVREQLTLPI